MPYKFMSLLIYFFEGLHIIFKQLQFQKQNSISRFLSKNRLYHFWILFEAAKLI
jgi:hypothetical protein